MKGLSEDSIYNKIYGYERMGFNPRNEIRILLKKFAWLLNAKERI